eukprot:c24790_g13_i1 orf=179-2359(-)
MPVSRDTIYPLVHTCATKKDLPLGRHLLAHMACNGLDTLSALDDQLIRLFAARGSLLEADVLFCRVENPSVFTWHAIITAHVIHGEYAMALDLFRCMQFDGIDPDKYVYTCGLRACANKGALSQGMLMHDQLVRQSFDVELVVLNSLVDLYAKCKCLDEAYRVFCQSPDPDVISWSTMIAGYAQFGHASYALELFQTMQGNGINPDRVSYLSILKACCSVGTVSLGKVIHGKIINDGLQSDVTIGNTLIDMYVKCGSLEEAQKVFEHLPHRDVVSWAAIIAGFSEHGRGFSAVDCFDKMREEGIEADRVTFLFLLKACGSIGALRKGKVIHEHIIRSGLESNVVVGSTVIDMYAKCGALEEAYRVFDCLTVPTVISWSTIIGAYIDHGHGPTALEIYNNLQQTDLLPDHVIFLSGIKACGSTGDLSQGRVIHTNIIKRGFLSDVTVGNSLVDMYSKCKSMEEARNVFDALPFWSPVSWSAILGGYIQQHQWAMVLDLFGKLQQEDLKLDNVVFLYALEACNNLGTVEQGKLIHDQIIRHGYEGDRTIGSALLDTYCKCGCLHEGYRVFNRLLCKDVVMWGAMIAGLVHGGDWPLARKCLLEMRQQGIKPNENIYTSILIACSCAGLLEEGQWYLNLMKEDHCDFAKTDNLSCIIDLLGRAGLLKESQDLMQTMPSLPNEVAWTSLLTSCKTYSNPSIGSHCFDEVMEASLADTSGYVLMSDNHSAA